MKTRALMGLTLVVSLSFGLSSATTAQAAPAAHRYTADFERAPVRGPVFTDEQRRIAQLVNDTRSERGKARLTLNPTLTRKAQAWAEHLARMNALAHSDLAAGAPSNWRALGENVGYARTIVDVHQAFMRSSGHRQNILGQWNAIGTGYAAGSGKVFVVHVFMRT